MFGSRFGEMPQEDESQEQEVAIKSQEAGQEGEISKEGFLQKLKSVSQEIAANIMESDMTENAKDAALARLGQVRGLFEKMANDPWEAAIIFCVSDAVILSGMLITLMSELSELAFIPGIAVMTVGAGGALASSALFARHYVKRVSEEFRKRL